MKELYILGNWKSNKTRAEAAAWRSAFDASLRHVPPGVTLIVCPAYHHLDVFSGNLSYALGVQDMSPFESGAYTGEVSADMLGGSVTYALIGHSERRRHLGETDDLIARKTERAIAAGIRPVVCVSEEPQAEALKRLVPEFGKSGLLLYEPLFAIGSGTADTPENADRAAARIHGILDVPILYGGSVTAQNVRGFATADHLSGVGVGGASLDPGTFLALVNAVS